MTDRQLVFYDKEGASYQPVKHFNAKTGRSAYRVKPSGASNRTRDFLELDTIEEVAKAMLVDKLPARVKRIHGTGPVSVLRFGADLLIRYELDPAIAQRLSIPASSGRAPTLPSPFNSLRKRFLAVFPDFEAVGGFQANTGSFYEVFRKPVDALLTVVAAHPTDGWAVLQDLIAASQGGRGALPPFLTGDLTQRARSARDVDPARFDAALDALVRDKDRPAAAAVAFNETFWPSLQAIGEPSAFRDTRVVPATILAAVAPDNAVSVRYSQYVNAERLLHNRPLFANKPLNEDEYRAVLALAEQIRAAITEWGWRPRDLWDVHGFILAACADTDKSPHRSMTPPGQEPRMPAATNLILYGPPGTGKTYATAWEAVRLCLGDAAAASLRHDRSALVAEYRRLVGAGRIEFVTFHQSFSYEDFIEGLRPTTKAELEGDQEQNAVPSGGFSLKPHAGVFKSISERARLDTGDAPTQRLDRSKPIYKIALGQRGSQEDRILEGLEGSLIHLGWGGDIDWSHERFDDFEEIRKKWNETKDPDASGKDPNIEMIYAFRSGLRVGDYVVISDGRDSYRAFGQVTGEYRFDAEADFHPHRRSVEWIWRDDKGAERAAFYPRNFRRQSAYRLDPDGIDWDALETVVIGPNAERPAAGARPHVLIIDEINRANISRVFGELITLIEVDKRLGCENEVKVRLPYSGTSFGVPPNLHIIATMNTADRSIALLDTALRRRFEFRELMPDTEELRRALAAKDLDAENLGGIDVCKLMRTINERIEYLFDREHQIGHAYFTGCGSRADVEAVMRHKIIPLLAEYFYEDWSKVAAVLGDAPATAGTRFLEARKLSAPAGFSEDDIAGDKLRWSVKASFDFSEFEVA